MNKIFAITACLMGGRATMTAQTKDGGLSADML